MDHTRRHKSNTNKTPLSKMLREELIFAQLVKCHNCYWTLRLITVIRPVTGLCPEPDRSSPSPWHSVSLWSPSALMSLEVRFPFRFSSKYLVRSVCLSWWWLWFVLIWQVLLHLGLSRCPFLSGFPSNILYAAYVSHDLYYRAMHPVAHNIKL
jgi:hypothetical protein